MTDNEIMKALECCFVDFFCNGCPLDNDAGGIGCHELGAKVLDLINRQQAKIKELEERKNK